MVYVGVDLHRKSSYVAVVADDGELLASRRIASQPDEFLRVFGELEAEPSGVAFEATYGWGWFADLLSDIGIPAHMVHPLATKAIDLLAPELAQAERELRELFRADPRIESPPSRGSGSPPQA